MYLLESSRQAMVFDYPHCQPGHDMSGLQVFWPFSGICMTV